MRRLNNLEMSDCARELLVATRNLGKVREIKDVLRGLPVKLRSLEEFSGVAPVEEDGDTYEENSILKALGYSKQTGLFALADDSGLEVDALAGLPGVKSARFGGEGLTDKERTEKLLRALGQTPMLERTARFVSCVALAVCEESDIPNSGTSETVLNIARGECMGVIADRARGANGFGYDPVFIPSGYDRTFAELDPEIKNTISHRARALSAIRQFLELFLHET